MMEWFILAWLYTAISSLIAGPIGLLIFLLGAALVGVKIMLTLQSDDAPDGVKSFANSKILWGALIAWIIISTIVPSRDDLKFITGAGVFANGAAWAINSEEAKQLPENVLSSLNHFLEQTEVAED